MRAECFHGIGVEHSAIRAGADRQGGDDIAVVGIENHHRFWVAASGKKNAILEIQCQPSTCATLAGEIVRAGYGELLGVHNRDFFLSSTSMYIWPLPSVAACSGIPPRSIVPTIEPSLASMTVTLGAL